jgi:hypothetical protein
VGLPLYNRCLALLPNLQAIDQVQATKQDRKLRDRAKASLNQLSEGSGENQEALWGYGPKEDGESQDKTRTGD